MSRSPESIECTEWIGSSSSYEDHPNEYYGVHSISEIGVCPSPLSREIIYLESIIDNRDTNGDENESSEEFHEWVNIIVIEFVFLFELWDNCNSLLIICNMRDSIEIYTPTNTFEENKKILLWEIREELYTWIADNQFWLDTFDPNIKTTDLRNGQIRDLFMEHINKDKALVKRLYWVFIKSNNSNHNGKFEGFWFQFANIKKQVYKYIVTYKQESEKSETLDELISDEVLKNSQREINEILEWTKSHGNQIKKIQKLIRNLLVQKHHDDLQDALLPWEED